MIMPALEVEHAYRACEDITRVEAANFYYGIRLLPRDKRQAMSAVYAFARRVDDIGDGHDENSEKLAALRAQRESLAAVADVSPDDQAWRERLLFAPGLRIGGGTDEIQRNTIAERGLSLPRS